MGAPSAKARGHVTKSVTITGVWYIDFKLKILSDGTAIGGVVRFSWCLEIRHQLRWWLPVILAGGLG